ncbi:MAG TPA: hypothetical protein VHM90_19040, partial [Phycisphaerae bacterium]|nr:hypothetical protein [Phycisphaerae bacterium]
PLAEALKPGDYVLIAVGTDSPLQVLPPREKFEAGLTTLVEAVRARKAIPLLADPAPALAADAKYDLAAAESWVHAVADKEKVQYLSVYPAADKWLNALGTANAASPFNVSSDPRAADLNHFSAYGAFEYAKLIALAIRDSKIELASHLYAEIPATNADPKQFPPALGYDYLKRE